MAKRLAVEFKNIQLRIVGPAAAVTVSRVQKFDITTNFPSNDINELGNNLHSGVVTGVPEITSTFQVMDVSPNVFAALTGNLAAYPAGGVSITELGDIDLIGQIKDADTNDYVKTVEGRKLKINGFNYAYAVNNEATEEYTAVGTEKRWFKNDVIVDKATSGGTTVTLSQTPIVLKNLNKLISVIVDGVYFDEVAAGPAAGEYSVSGTTVTLGTALVTQALCVYHAAPIGSNWSYISDSTIPAGVRGKNIPLTIGVNDIKRVQSVTIRGTFPNQKIEEQGNNSVIGYTTDIPQVTGDISVLDTDIDMIGLFATGNLGTVSGDTEFNACEFTASGLSLAITIHNPAQGCGTAGTVLKTIYIPSITITSEGHSTAVGGNATQTFAFKSTLGELVIYSGAKP